MRRIVPSLAVIFVVLAILSVTGIPAPSAQELTFSVAISMKEATEELGRRFMQSRAGVVLRYNFASSGELQKQIEAGAPVDLFLSAAPRQMDELEKKGLIVPATRRGFAPHVLTILKPATSTIDNGQPTQLLQPPVNKIVIRK